MALHIKLYENIVVDTIAEDSSFLEATEDLFFKIQSGHMGRFLYYDTQNDKYKGIVSWNDCVANGMTTMDKVIFQYSLSQLSELLGKNQNIVEFGPGSMKDAEYLLSVFGSVLYVAIDINPSIEDIGKKLVKEKFPNCKFEFRNLDFFKESRLVTNTPAIGVMLGLTIGNVPGPITSEYKERLTFALSRLSSFLPDNSYMIITIDTCQEGHTNIKYYKPMLENMVLGIFHRMNIDLPMTNFDPDAFKYEPVWISESSLVAHIVTATKNQRFKLGEKEVCIFKDESFHIQNSYRFESAVFEVCARDAGLSVERYWQQPPDTARLYLLKKKLEHGYIC